MPFFLSTNTFSIKSQDHQPTEKKKILRSWHPLDPTMNVIRWQIISTRNLCYLKYVQDMLVSGVAIGGWSLCYWHLISQYSNNSTSCFSDLISFRLSSCSWHPHWTIWTRDTAKVSKPKISKTPANQPWNSKGHP